MSAQAVQKPLHQLIPGCASASVEQGRFSLIFRTEKAADDFTAQMETALKADEVMGAHCKPFIPQGFSSYKAYLTELAGVKTYLMYEVELDDQFDASQFFSAIAALNKD